jgi:protein-S-isoprenylcysteine O-methyltransferase Ste14
LAIDEWRCVLGVFLIVLGYWIKARIEERMLSVQFGAVFEEHCRHTGFLLPRF